MKSEALRHAEVDIIAHELAVHAERAIPYLRGLAEDEEDFATASTLTDIADRLQSMVDLHRRVKGK